MNTQGNTEKSRNDGGITMPDFKLYYRAIAITAVLYWHKNRHEDKWNRTPDMYVSPLSCTHLSFTKLLKTYDGEKTASSTNVVGKTGYLPVEN
jgi:hypothetical protein